MDTNTKQMEQNLAVGRDIMRIIRSSSSIRSELSSYGWQLASPIVPADSETFFSEILERIELNKTSETIPSEDTPLFNSGLSHTRIT